MHAISLLKRWCERNGVIGHRARLGALLRVVDALLSGGKLALTHLGRNRPGDAFIKHHIKAVDRLLGNRHLHGERLGVYAAMARTLLAHSERPLIVVDWADCELERGLLILKAAVPLGGRAITIYEEVHRLSRYNSPKTHRRFLRHLKEVLPDHVCPIIVTDAGFRGPWFREVESYGWDWIGRIRNSIKYFKPETGRWCDTRSLYREATPRVRHIGWRCLSKRHRYWCRLYLVRAYYRGPGRPRKRKSYGTNDGLYRKLHRAPWLLATSLSHASGNGKTIMRAYARRMEIEETFRDLKNHRWGFALRYARTTSTERLEVLLLVAVLATLLLWLMGLAATGRQWTRHFQPNTERRRSVLSTVFLGQQLWKNNHLRVTHNELTHAFEQLTTLLAQQAQFA
ncbi:MAG: IS4 family transposase [Acidiferrobacterales bacterium]